jgi:hypothetical protein
MKKKKLDLPFSASDVIPLDSQAKKERDQDAGGGANVPAVLMQNKFLCLGEREIERHQTMASFAVSKNHRLDCQIHFKFCGNEKERIMEILEAFRLGISKLRILGTLMVTDDLLVWLLGKYPLLRSVEFYLDDPLCNQVRSEGLVAVV